MSTKADGTGGLWSARLPPACGRLASLPRPGPVHGAYPLKPMAPRAASAWAAWCQARWRAPAPPSARQDARLLQAVRQASLDWAALPAAQRGAQLLALRAQLGVQGLSEPLVARSFGLIDHLVQVHHGFALHDTQLQAAWWMLGERLVEMATGEGKTLTMFLTAATAALAGVPVHVLTANDYLARRDALQLQPLYANLGLRCQWVSAASNPADRRLAYQADVVHVTAREVAFDYLRDRVATSRSEHGSVVLRGLCMALIDEADSILIDEACTPLILARPGDARAAQQRYRLALYLAGQLQQGRDFLTEANMQVSLTAAGVLRLADLSRHLHGEWRWQRFVAEQVCCALQALHAFHKDVHYLVRDQVIHIVDDTTGRLAVGRAWSRGLHQMIAIKEKVSAPAENDTLTQTSYQAFFPRYLRLAGISGTLAEDRGELLRVYGLPVCRVRLRAPSRRQLSPTRMLATQADKWRQVVDSAVAQASQGRPVLIGTDTVADCEQVSAALAQRGIVHQVLNARQDDAQGAQENKVVTRAGEPGCITVATHMAGRGTDIHLPAASLASGGLHVINTHLNRSRRIDRQLLGRCARQGTPGSGETILSWQDPCWQTLPGGGWWALVLRAACLGWLRQAAARRWCLLAQGHWEAQARQRRWALCQAGVAMGRQLALAGSEDWR